MYDVQLSLIIAARRSIRALHKRQSMLFHSHGGATYTASTDAYARRIPNIAYYLTRSMSGIPSSYLVHIWYGKARMTGLHLGKVAWCSTQLYLTAPWILHSGLVTISTKRHLLPRERSACGNTISPWSQERSLWRQASRTGTYNSCSQKETRRSYWMPQDIIRKVGSISVLPTFRYYPSSRPQS